MPELPEVETMARGLASWKGQILRDLRLNDQKVWFQSELPPEAFRGRRVERISRRGKYLVFHFDHSSALVAHLRMTGKFLPKESQHLPLEVLRVPAKRRQLRAEFSLSGGDWVFFDTRRFGTLTAVADPEKFFQDKGIAPDALEEQDRARVHFISCVKQTKRPIKSVLLDQAVIAGAGNIYADEALFAAHVHPLTPASKALSSADQIFTELLALFRRAVAFKGTTVLNYRGADGAAGGFARELKVYGRAGEPCGRCERGHIKAITVGGRTTCFCPKCQNRVLTKC